MSQANVEVVRRAVEAFRAGDMQRVFGMVDPAVEWDLSRATTWPEQPLYRGYDDVLRFFTEWTGEWDDYEFDLEELLDAGDRVVAVVRDGGRSKTAGIKLERRHSEVWTLRDGKIVRIDLFDTKAEALEAVGLRE
jgi:ketosteroid isomerase-like protein